MLSLTPSRILSEWYYDKLDSSFDVTFIESHEDQVAAAGGDGSIKLFNSALEGGGFFLFCSCASGCLAGVGLGGSRQWLGRLLLSHCFFSFSFFFSNYLKNPRVFMVLLYNFVFLQ